MTLKLMVCRKVNVKEHIKTNASVYVCVGTSVNWEGPPTRQGHSHLQTQHIHLHLTVNEV